MSTVLIGHASISEKGTANGAKGDSTGKEVCIRSWYSKPWDFMAIHLDAKVREKHARAIEDACVNNNIGYSQSSRNTLNTLAKAVGYNLLKVGKCNCDCSSLQNVAAVASGAKGVTYGSNGWTTSTMKSALQSAGYKIITDRTYLKSADYCVRGAIYVKSGSHTVCGLTNGAKARRTLMKAGIISGSITSTTKTSTTSYSKTQFIKDVQSAIGAKVDGIAGTETLSKTITVSKTANSKHAVVKPLQKYLNFLGYNCGIVDGIAGTKFDVAVKAFQKDNRCVVDGEITAHMTTWKKLLGLVQHVKK